VVVVAAGVGGEGSVEITVVVVMCAIVGRTAEDMLGSGGVELAQQLDSIKRSRYGREEMLDWEWHERIRVYIPDSRRRRCRGAKHQRSLRRSEASLCTLSWRARPPTI
jgi:hypothetical protein